MMTDNPSSPNPSTPPRVFPNRFEGVCVVCGVRVAPGAGVFVKADGQSSVLCASHAGGWVRQPRGLRIRVSLSPSGDQVYFQPSGWLGAEFERYRGALSGSTTYRKEDRRSEAPLGQLSALSDRLRAAGFELEVHPDVVAAAQAHDAQTRAQVEDARGHARAADEILRASGRALMPFQAEGVEWLSSMSGAILADEMGLGKTIQVLLAAPSGAGGILVVCPKVAKGVWVREAARWRADLRVAVLAGRGSFRWPEAGELVVTNYEILPGDADRPDVIASCPRGVTLVADEGHALKAGKGKSGSARGRAFDALSRVVRDRGGRAWLVTGSPQLNDSYAEQWNLLGMVGQAGTVFGTYDEFLALCGGRRGTYGVEWDGSVDASVPERLRRAMLRRVKREVMPQMPEKVVEVVDISLDRATVRALEAELIELRAAGIDPLGALEEARKYRLRFDQVSRLRETLSRAKLPHALEMIAELEEAGEPVVVGSAHRAAIDVLGARPGWAAITGDTSDADRRRIADAFQAGELRGVAGTIQAMGVAITLTRAHEMIVIDPMWVPELNRQLEDRIHRIGQAWTCRIRYLRADHAVDHAAFSACELKDEFVRRTIGAAAVVHAPVPVIATEGALAQAQAAPDAETEDPVDLEVLLAQIRASREAADVAKIRRESARRSAAAAASRGYVAPPRSEGVQVGAAIGAPVDAQEGSPRGPESVEEHWAAHAIAQLAGACDGAVTEDGAGFMKSDVALGHSIAASVPHGLSDLEWAVAVQICRRYPRQVGRPGAEDEAEDE